MIWIQDTTRYCLKFPAPCLRIPQILDFPFSDCRLSLSSESFHYTHDFGTLLSVLTVNQRASALAFDVINEYVNSIKIIPSNTASTQALEQLSPCSKFAQNI